MNRAARSTLYEVNSNIMLSLYKLNDMSNLDELINLEDRLQPVLLAKYYTVIGPTNSNEFDKFVQAANRNIDGFTIHQVLKNRNAIRNLLKAMNYSGDLRIYVMYANDHSMLLHSTVEEYIANNNINFQL